MSRARPYGWEKSDYRRIRMLSERERQAARAELRRVVAAQLEQYLIGRTGEIADWITPHNATLILYAYAPPHTALHLIQDTMVRVLDLFVNGGAGWEMFHVMGLVEQRADAVLEELVPAAITVTEAEKKRRKKILLELTPQEVLFLTEALGPAATELMLAHFVNAEPTKKLAARFGWSVRITERRITEAKRRLRSALPARSRLINVFKLAERPYSRDAGESQLFI